MSYVTPGLRTKIRFCQVIAEDLLFTGTITEGTTVCQYVNTETQDVQVSSTYKVRVIGILLPKLFWPTVRKNCSSDRENLLKFEAQGWEFTKFLRSLEWFIRTVKGQKNVCQQVTLVSGQPIKILLLL